MKPSSPSPNSAFSRRSTSSARFRYSSKSRLIFSSIPALLRFAASEALAFIFVPSRETMPMRARPASRARSTVSCSIFPRSSA